MCFPTQCESREQKHHPLPVSLKEQENEESGGGVNDQHMVEEEKKAKDYEEGENVEENNTKSGNRDDDKDEVFVLSGFITNFMKQVCKFYRIYSVIMTCNPCLFFGSVSQCNVQLYPL